MHGNAMTSARAYPRPWGRGGRALIIVTMLFTSAAVWSMQVSVRFADFVPLFFTYGYDRYVHEDLHFVRAAKGHMLVSNGDELGTGMQWLRFVSLVSCMTVLGGGIIGRGRKLLPPRMLELGERFADQRRDGFPWLHAAVFFGCVITLVTLSPRLWPHWIVIAIGMAWAWIEFGRKEAL